MAHVRGAGQNRARPNRLARPGRCRPAAPTSQSSSARERTFLFSSSSPHHATRVGECAFCPPPRWPSTSFKLRAPLSTRPMSYKTTRILSAHANATSIGFKTAISNVKEVCIACIAWLRRCRRARIVCFMLVSPHASPNRNVSVFTCRGSSIKINLCEHRPSASTSHSTSSCNASVFTWLRVLPRRTSLENPSTPMRKAERRR